MNRFISFVAGSFLSLVATFIAGYWNSRGVVALGDMRVPAPFVGVVVLIIGAIASGALGGFLPWNRMPGFVRDLFGRLKQSPSTVPVATNDGVRSKAVDVTSIPIQVEHLLRCVHHLRVALRNDKEGQELMDQIQIKIGRVSAQIDKLDSAGGV